VFEIAGDGVHGEYDGLGTLALPSHYQNHSRVIIAIIGVSELEQERDRMLLPNGRRTKMDKRVQYLHHSSALLRLRPISLWRVRHQQLYQHQMI
jgi:hypothetical protein